MEYDYRKMGQLIHKLRKKKGLSQEVLSGLASIGRTHLSMIETGSKNASIETLWQLANALNISMSTLFSYYEVEYKD